VMTSRWVLLTSTTWVTVRLPMLMTIFMRFSTICWPGMLEWLSSLHLPHWTCKVGWQTRLNVRQVNLGVDLSGEMVVS